MVVQQLRIQLTMQGTWIQPLLGNISHAVGRLSAHTTTEPAGPTAPAPPQ